MMTSERVGNEIHKARALVGPKPAAAALFFTSALLFGLVAFAAPAPQTASRPSREIDFDTRNVSVVTFASSVHTSLTVECWRQRRLHLTWAVEAAGAGRAYTAQEVEAIAGREIKVGAGLEGDAINIRVAADGARFKAERAPRSAENPRGVILRDKVTGLEWSIRLKAFVPYGLKIDSRDFVGTTSVECGAESATGSRPTTKLDLTGGAGLDGGTATATATADAVTVESATAMSLLVERVEPRYPAVAAEAGVRGPVKLSVLVNDTGEVEKVWVTRGHPLLSDAAVRAVSLWRFKPYTTGGRAASFITSLTVDF